MRALYVVASYLLFALLFPFLSLNRKTRDGLAQRLGFYAPGTFPEGGGPRIWMHGASAGDLLALSPMVDLLRARFPKARIVMSTMTNSGALMARERLRSRLDAVVFVPYDLKGATERAMAAFRPPMLVLEYTEVWPNLIRAAKNAGARVVMTNGRFAKARMWSYHLLFGLIDNPLRDFDALLMREEDEAERVLELGAPKERVFVTGNTKFDALVTGEPALEDARLRSALGFPHSARVWICGSTHEGEEDLLIEVFQRLLKDHPDLRMVMAPRYIDRAPKLIDLATAAGLTSTLRSNGNAQGARVVILDTIGELARAYRLATLVFVGGSFTERGGQNILEPAGQGKPVLFGPNMENFHDSVQVLVGRGGIQVKDEHHLHQVMDELLRRPGDLKELGDMALGTVRQVSGASARNAERMASLLEGSGPWV